MLDASPNTLVSGAVKADLFYNYHVTNYFVCSRLVGWSYLGRKRVCLIQMPFLLSFVIYLFMIY